MSTQQQLTLEFLSIILRQVKALPREQGDDLLKQVTETLDHAVKRQDLLLGLRDRWGSRN